MVRRLRPEVLPMSDARIAVIREAMLMGYGLFMADAQIRELLSALDKIGKPLPARADDHAGRADAEAAGIGGFVLDLLADANAHDEAHQPADGGTR
jgi:hypothetical protein